MRPSVCALFALAATGCYAPAPPSGAYLCGTGNACPGGQLCECGQCVNKRSDAACGFAVDATQGGQVPTVAEHQPFALAVQALGADGKTPSAGFNGLVAFSSSWGDVTPATVQLSGGKATVMIQLNRETLPPAVAIVSVSFVDREGSSGDINVTAPRFTLDPSGIEAPFGWAQHFAAEANVTKVGSGYRMYFLGGGPLKSGLGVATSTDGKTFTPASDPVLSSPNLGEYFSPSAFVTAQGTQLAYGSGSGIFLATSPDGMMPFVNPISILDTSQCSYCSNTATFPQVLSDTTVKVAMGQAPPWLMFFSAVKSATSSVSIARASSPDGVTWTPEPAPVLSGDLEGESVLLSPRVFLDGHVYKMYYSFARFVPHPCTGANGTQGTCATGQICQNNSCAAPVNPNDGFGEFCAGVGIEVNVGYATSADGNFWTRSLSNPVIAISGPNITPGLPPEVHAILVSSVLPSDGVNASSGVTLYYSTFRRVLAVGNRCLPNGIARATRP